MLKRMDEFTLRRARTSDVVGIQQLVAPLVDRRILLGKELVVLYEAVQEFVVAEASDGTLIGCGALHVIWENLGEVRTLAVAETWLHRGVGRAIVLELERNALELGLSKLFCLTSRLTFSRDAALRPSPRASSPTMCMCSSSARPMRASQSFSTSRE